MMTRRILASLVLACMAGSALFGQSGDEVEKQVAVFFRAAEAGSATLVAEAEKTVALGPEIGPYLLDGLGKRSPDAIVWALRCYKVVGAGDGEEALSGFCSHDSADVRAEAMVSLSALHPEAAVSRAHELMKDREVVVRRRAIDALVAHAPSDVQTISVAFDALTDGDFWICSRAIRLLSRVDCSTEESRAVMVQRCVPMVPKLDARTAGLVIGLVVSQTGKASLPVLAAAARRDLPSVQAAAFGAAARLGLDQLLDDARRHIDRKDSEARLPAIRYVAALRDRDSMRRLVGVIENEKDPAREAAVVALRQISGQSFGYEPDRWRAWIAASETARN